MGMVVAEAFPGALLNRFLGFAPKRHIDFRVNEPRLHFVIPTGVMRSITLRRNPVSNGKASTIAGQIP
ncbi:MAG: hypothetical protein ACYS0H_06420, partial [Planctomycetota bacterium]